ncbi:hypothetical protein KXW25_000871 [Aspergillus fumigatus]|nr:hypothetical protein KXW25_000871 [Aspergillus fumigatus]
MMDKVQRLKRARILAFGYDARVVDWNMVSQNRIGNHSRNLLQAVADYRENDMTNDRHIIFVAHSLGGLICEDALVVSSRSVEKYLRSVFNCTFGLAFMGTPHHGSDMAQWAETMRKFTSVFKQTNPELLRALERDSEVLARIQDEFHTLLRSRSKDSPLEIFCFYEEKPLTVVGTVVPMDSAILPGYLHASLPYDHRDMTKFASVDDPGFITVTNVLRRWVRAISEVAPRPAGQILNIYQTYRGTDKISDTNTGKLLSVARCANCNALNHPTSKCKWEKGDDCHKCIFSPFISIIPHLLLNNANTSKANNMGTGQQNVNIPENATSAAAMATCEAIADTQKDAIIVDNMTISVQNVPGRFLKRGVPLMILYHAYGKCLQLGWVKLIAQAHIMYGRDDIAKLEAEVDLSEFVIPIGNLLEPGVADAVLAALSRFIVDKTGTELGILYQGLNEDCLSKTENHCHQQNANVATITDSNSHIIDGPSGAKQAQERRHKHKTQPAHSSMHSMSPAAAITATLEDNRASPVFKVKPETFNVFSVLFARSQSRGSISWTAFEAAMTDLNFSITPKWGSVLTFYSPQDSSVQRSLTLHRPHNSHIEGFRLLFIAKRLKRTFGWEEGSFALA